MFGLLRVFRYLGQTMKIEDMEKILEEKLDLEDITPTSSQDSETNSLENLKMDKELNEDTTDHVAKAPTNSIQMNHTLPKLINTEDVKIKPVTNSTINEKKLP